MQRATGRWQLTQIEAARLQGFITTRTRRGRWQQAVAHQAGEHDVMDDLRLVAVISGRRRAHVLRLRISTVRSVSLPTPGWSPKSRVSNAELDGVALLWISGAHAACRCVIVRDYRHVQHKRQTGGPTTFVCAPRTCACGRLGAAVWRRGRTLPRHCWRSCPHRI